MSIFGSNPNKWASPEPKNVDLSEYARKDYVDQKVNYHVLRSGDTMSGNLNMRRKLVYGLPTDYPPRYAGDEAVSWGQALGLMNEYFLLALRLDGASTMRGHLQMGNHFIKDVNDPIQPQDAATKNYVDGRKPIITVWAESVSDGAWSFGSSSYTGDENFGYTFPVAGRVLYMGLRTIMPPHPDIFGYSRTHIVKNGERSQWDYVSTIFGNPKGSYIHFDIPLEFAAGDVLNFETHVKGDKPIAQIATVLIELDI